jgi:hypothetical protein
MDMRLIGIVIKFGLFHPIRVFRIILRSKGFTGIREIFFN